jgi:hypothetical protein
MYSVGQERRLVDPPSQVVAGVRTVTTNMDGRDALPRMSRPFAFLRTIRLELNTENWNDYFVLEFTRLLFFVVPVLDFSVLPLCLCGELEMKPEFTRTQR